MIESNPVVLLVEDDTNTIRALRLSLLKAGFGNKVLEAHDGQEAVDYLRGEGEFSNRLRYPLPQLILLDLKLPRMDGFEFLKWLRAWPPGKFIPVVVLTTAMMASDLVEAYNAGASSYVLKGADAHELVEQLTGIGSVWLRGGAKVPSSDVQLSVF